MRRKKLFDVIAIVLLLNGMACTRYAAFLSIDGVLMGPGFSKDGKALTWGGKGEVPEEIYQELDQVIEEVKYGPEVTEIQEIYNRYAEYLEEPYPYFKVETDAQSYTWKVSELQTDEYLALSKRGPEYLNLDDMHTAVDVTVFNGLLMDEAPIKFKINLGDGLENVDGCELQNKEIEHGSPDCFDVREETDYQVLYVIGYLEENQ